MPLPQRPVVGGGSRVRWLAGAPLCPPPALSQGLLSCVSSVFLVLL